jgi:SAM-dependent methyltransferase
MAATLELGAPRGVVLDAGCGDGLDLVNHASRPGVEVIGVDLSDGGCQTSAARIRGFGTAHVVQADLRRLPFADGLFDRVYSYGVLHHLATPEPAAAELARVSRRDAELAIYLYEDFSERSPLWRALLAIVNRSRAVTTQLPPRLLYALCCVGSPRAFLFLTVPHRVLRHVPGLKSFAASLPYRHGRGPFTLIGDLYDRFSAPVEHRYSRHTARNLMAGAGLTVTKVAYERGWMVAARRVGA